MAELIKPPFNKETARAKVKVKKEWTEN